MSNLMIISADCHAGAQPKTYREYLPRRFREAADVWWKALESSSAIASSGLRLCARMTARTVTASASTS